MYICIYVVQIKIIKMIKISLFLPLRVLKAAYFATRGVSPVPLSMGDAVQTSEAVGGMEAAHNLCVMLEDNICIFR